MAYVTDHPPQSPTPSGHPSLWSALAEAQTADQMCRAWLALLCTGLLQADSGLLLLLQPDGAFVPVAAHPLARDLSHLREVATDALRSRNAAVLHDPQGTVQLAFPLLAADGVQGAVVLQFARATEAELDAARQHIRWGAGWLVGLLHQRALALQEQRLHQGGMLLDTLLSVLAERSPREAALALVNSLGREFNSQQVHLSWLEGQTLNRQALSHAAWFVEKAHLLLLASQAMHEAIDQSSCLVWPLPGNAEQDNTSVQKVRAAHQRYAEECGAKALISLPLLHEGLPVGALLLERSTAFTPGEVAYLERLALGLAPGLVLHRQAHESATRRVLRAGRDAAALVFGPRYPALKLGAAVLGVLLLLLAVVPVPFRIASQALVEGSVQRAAVVPFAGYLRAAPARAGDIVKAGQVLAVLDDRDLKLEQSRWASELEVALRKEREAMAAGNAVDQRLAGAQANQARAQLDLAQSKLERVTITAPFDGTVVKGDLSQQLGSPLEQGKVLFELAPLDAWRVILKVDERDIDHVRVGAKGELVLASLPGQALAFTVRKLTPVAVAEDGRNHFRVEAELGQSAPRLSPNMEGVGKVDAGQASPLWIWTRPLLDWMRLACWKLLP
jgi:biotin carboxyl carrier protein